MSNALVSLFEAWHKPFKKVKDQDVGKGQYQFYSVLKQWKKDRNLPAMERLRTQFQREMTTLAKRRLNNELINTFFAERIHDLDRAFRYSVYELHSNPHFHPILAKKFGNKTALLEKRNLDHEIERYLRKISY